MVVRLRLVSGRCCAMMPSFRLPVRVYYASY